MSRPRGRPKKIVSTASQLPSKRFLVQPGPWSFISPKFKLKARLKPNSSISPSVGKYLGIYRDKENWAEEKTYPIIINVTASTLYRMSIKYDTEQVLAACERSLNEPNKEGKRPYGKIVILEILSDHSKNPNKNFISCVAKTTKKNIKGFLLVKGGSLIVI